MEFLLVFVYGVFWGRFITRRGHGDTNLLLGQVFTTTGSLVFVFGGFFFVGQGGFNYGFFIFTTRGATWGHVYIRGITVRNNFFGKGTP